MAEQTPDNLGVFGGHVQGRAADDNRGIDRATDRLESEINKMSDALERLTSAAGRASGGGGGPAQTSHGNGGQVTFQGSGGSHRAETAPGILSRGASAVTSTVTSPFIQTGGAHTPGPTSHRAPQAANRMGQAAGYAGKGIAVTAGASVLMAANHYSSQQTGQTLAAMQAGGPDWNAAYQASFRDNYTAHGDKDHWGMISGMSRSGFAASGDPRYRQAAEQTMSYSAVNPAMSNVAAQTGQQALATTTSFNRMARMGINPINAQGQGDPRSIARQLLSKMNNRVKTKEQVFAAFGAAGSATVTLDSYVAAGYLPPESRELVKTEMMNILLAQVGGMSADTYTNLAMKANTSQSARDTLEKVGVATDTQSQMERRSEGKKRETEGETIVGFARGVRGATATVDKFREALNKFLELPGMGEGAGLLGGFGARIPAVGGVLSRITGMIPGVGDGPASMSGSQMSYSAASGAGNPGAGFGGMSSASMRSSGGGGHPTSSGSSQPVSSRYSLGGVKPWVAKAASILGPMFGISSIGGVGSRPGPSDHPSGHALDFMCGKSQGDRLAAYAVQNHRDLNITYVIWRQRIWSTSNKGWRGMEDRGSITANHFDHVHISFLRSPVNGDYSNMPSGGGIGGSKGKGMGLGQGASSPDNGSAGGATATGFSPSGGFSEAASLGLGGGGVMSALGGGAGGGAGALGGAGGGSGRRGGGGGVGGLGGYGSGAAGTLVSGTYNVGSLKGATNPVADVKKLIGPADVLSLTEVNAQRLAGLRKGLAGDNWGVYAGDGSATGRYALGTAVAYDKDKYDLVKGGTYKLGDTTGNFLGGKGKRFANYALLKDKSSGMSFWQVSAHTVPMANADMAHRKMHREQFNSLDDLSKMLQKTGIPVIMGGDFNQQRNRDFWRNPAGMNSARGGGVDHVFGQVGKVKTSGINMVGGLTGDHSGAVLASMSIKGTGGGTAARGNGGSPAQNIALGRSMAANRGWTGEQWNDLKNLWHRESGWRTNADNPTSSAYGIPQALTQLHGLGDDYMKDPRKQIQWGLNYIAGRYGNPSKAWDFWQKNNYYKQGAWNIKEDKEAQIHMGEMILPSKIADIVRDELTSPGIRNALGSSKGGGNRGQVIVTFQEGAIQVGLTNGSEGEARQAGRMIVDAMMEDNRLSALAEGR